MQRLWDHPNIAREMGVAAQARYNELFTSQKTTEQYVELYRMLTNEKASNEQD
jgi:rhamnosyl/mannosyltransferase